MIKPKTIVTAILSFVSSLCYAQTYSPLTLHYDRPATFFEEALVIGNGSQGAIVYGGTGVDKISLNDITLWTGEPDRDIYSPDAHKSIPGIREALRRGDYAAVDKLQREVQGHYSQNYQPLGQLTVEYLNESGKVDTVSSISRYQRWLDISNATAHTRYFRGSDDYSVEYFASAPDSAIVIRIKTDSPKGLHARMSLASQVRHKTLAYGSQIVTDGYVGWGSLPSYVDTYEKFSYDENRGIHFRTILKVESDNKDNVAVDGNSLVVNGSKEVVLYVVNATSFNGYDKDPVKEGKDYKTIAAHRLTHALSKSYDELLGRHITDYKTIFDRVSLRLYSGPEKTVSDYVAIPTDKQLLAYVDESEFNPELEALYFQYGRYLLISCSRTPNVPANLQGLWNESILPPWSCNYTSNINLEENYWPAEIANMPEMHNSLFTFLKELQGSGERTAKAYYGVDRGWCLAHNTDIWAMTCPVGMHSGDPNWANWNMGGAWVSTHIWEHYMFSLDKLFLDEYYGILKGAAEFCMAWLVEEKSCVGDASLSTNYLLTSPSTSPENIYVTPEGYHGRTVFGGSADVAMIRECLIAARTAAIELKTDRDFVKRVDDILPRLLPYKIGKRGNIQEWYYDWDDEEPTHRHQSHLYGLYPGHNLADGVHSEAELKAAAAKTLEIKGDKTTGWSTGWRVNLFARLHDSAKAYHIYRKLLNYISPDKYSGPDKRRGGGTYPNLLDAHSPFQIDGNFGGCAGVIEMLVQSKYGQDGTDTMELLPALPTNWNNGAVRGIRARGGYTIEMEWENGEVSSLVISSLSKRNVVVTVNGMTLKAKLKKGRNIIPVG